MAESSSNVMAHSSSPTGVSPQERLSRADRRNKNTPMEIETVKPNSWSDSPDHKSTSSSITNIDDQPNSQSDPPESSSIPVNDDQESPLVAGENSRSNVSELTNNNDVVINSYLKLSDVTHGWWKAKSTLENDSDAISLLHLAVREGNNYFVQKLLEFIKDKKQIENKNPEGKTALHIAAIVGNKVAAEMLVEKRKEVLLIMDDNKELPLISAYEKGQLSTFIYLWDATDEKRLEYFPPDDRDSKKLKIGVNLMRNAICMKQYDLALKLANIYPLVIEDNEVLLALTRNFPNKPGLWQALIYPSLENFGQQIVATGSSLFYPLIYFNIKVEDIWFAMRRLHSNNYNCLLPEIALGLLAVLYPICQLIYLLVLLLFVPFFTLYFLLWKALAYLVVSTKHIEKKTKEYKEAKDILSLIFVQIKKSGANKADVYRKSLLEAVRLDVLEVLQQVLDSEHDDAINDIKNDNRHNIIQLAVINRSEKVYKLIAVKVKGTESYITLVDSFENNLLHLAGRVAPSVVSSRITGAALQLQKDLQWFKEVEKLIEPRQRTQENRNKETPELVFTREHADLVKEGEAWMKATANACSIIAALVASALFAAAITVGGHSDKEKGIPLFEKDTAFIIYAVSTVISLNSALTALLVCLSISTSTRFAEEDFLVTLPRQLLIGLGLLLLSTTTMIFSFSAILFQVFGNQRQQMLASLIGLSCFPIAAVVFLQLPLVVDLFRSIYFPVFGKQKSH